MIYHALNRGNRREAVFHKPADYDAFVEAIADARRRLPVDIFEQPRGSKDRSQALRASVT